MPAKSEQQDKLQQRSCSQRRAACFSAGEREPSVTPSSPFSWSGNIKIMRGCCSAAWGEGGVLEGLEGTFLWVTAGRGVSTGSSMGRADVGYCFQEWVLCVGPMKLWGWDGVEGWAEYPSHPTSWVMLLLLISITPMAWILLESISTWGMWEMLGVWEGSRNGWPFTQEPQ